MRRAVLIGIALAAIAWPVPSAARPREDAAQQQPAPPDAHDHATPPAGPQPQAPSPSAGCCTDGRGPAGQQTALPPNVPPLTDEDRAAAFPDLDAHAAHGETLHAFVLVDRLEWRHDGDAPGAHVHASGWIGGDLDRFRFRVDGSGDERQVRSASVHALYGRAITRWWDLVAGVRQDLRPGSPQTWAAIGVEGLAPYWFEVEATAYVAASGRTRLRVETEYELLVTNRLVLQPRVGLDVYGRADPERNVGAGVSAADWGLRLRYEIRRELAPYAGVHWHRTFFGTRERTAAAGEPTGGTSLTVGLRFWI